jgi:TRAP-type C4-dicarboxylate transport system permease small subunit
MQYIIAGIITATSFSFFIALGWAGWASWTDKTSF